LAETVDLSSWIGRTETAADVVVRGPLDRLAATLDRDDPPFRTGDAVPPCWHWLLFLPDACQSALEPDGHPKRGDFLPPIHHPPRHMWDGSRIAFPGAIRVGRDVVRRSTIAAVTEKQGSSGALVFVTVRHDIGEADGPIAIVDEHDIV
jgi:3-methylfumaryl-CoA hydratase